MKESVEFKACPFCGASPELIIKHPMYGPVGAQMKCRCGASGKLFSINECFTEGGKLCTPVTYDAIMAGVRNAITSWNDRHNIPH